MELERGGEPAPAVKLGLGAVVGAGLLGLVLYAAASPHWAASLGGGLVVAATFTVAGGLLGFLFGIPRLLTSGAAAHPADQGATSTASYAPNTNLEQVSDWLTKILLGAGLTQIGTLPRRLRELGDWLAPVVGGDPVGGPGGRAGAAGFAAALAVYFTVLGFVAGWLLTRLLLARALSSADRQTLADSVAQTVISAGSLGFRPEQVRELFDTGVEGLRVQALALMQGAPDPRHLDLIVKAIDRHLSPFELLQALLAARELATAPGMTDTDRATLRDAVAYKLRNSRTVPPYSRRRVVAEEVLKRLPEAGGRQPGGPGAGTPGGGAQGVGASAVDVPTARVEG
ncbi:hypothetical protein GCM10010441_39020 [Kitasatospora paracochleata]|uniref:DUF4129 domain-containing protein n=1 Tax=Kitasatospora paracochleata TaxID=58354 RepID=A0ABT1IPE8_9ACTN|nr:hypothetical protein [Kitasatospora paracochleata]MCP2306984.1 hypothetical protein [Kitasatospora paracochleata]